MAEEVLNSKIDDTRDGKVAEGVGDVGTESFSCLNCGGTLAHDIKSQEFMCRSCRTVYDIKTLADSVREYSFTEYIKRENEAAPYSGPEMVSCEKCGAEITFSEFQFASVCPMCSSPQIISAKLESRILPDGIMPFKIDKQDAQQRFRSWAKSRWFAPNDFKKSYSEGGLKGMYLPFWTFDADTVSYYTGRGGIIRTVEDDDGKTHTTTDWYPVSGVVTKFFDDVLVCSSDKEKMVNKIFPYRTTTGALPYSSAYLSGYYGEVYKLRADVCFETAKSVMENELRSLAESQIKNNYDVAQVTSMSTKHSNVKYKNMLLPLWGSIFGYKKKKYTYLINGETGKVAGQRPYSVPKIAAAIIVGILIILVICMLAGDDSSYGYENVDAVCCGQFDDANQGASEGTEWYQVLYDTSGNGYYIEYDKGVSI